MFFKFYSLKSLINNSLKFAYYNYKTLVLFLFLMLLLNMETLLQILNRQVVKSDSATIKVQCYLFMMNYMLSFF